MADAAMLADEIGYWQEHPDFPLEDWKYEVVNGDTRLGYWDWIANQMEADDGRN